MKALIGNNLITKLVPKDKQYDVRDSKLLGFLIRVNPSGRMMYVCEYKRGRRISIGRVGVLTPAQARDKALAILGEVAKGNDPKEDDSAKPIMTLQMFIDDHYEAWYMQHRRGGLKTLPHIRRCFISLFGKKLLDEITPVLIDHWRTQRLKGNVSTETVNRDIATLKAALSKAVLWGFVDAHPLEKLKLLKVDRAVKIRYLSTSEEQQLREAAIKREEKIKKQRASANHWREARGYELLAEFNQNNFADHLFPMILLSINTGMRQGELFNLAWQNVDLENGMLTIEGAYAKSGRTRHIPLNKEALLTLKTWREQTEHSELVFTNKEGVRFDNVKKSWAGLLKAANIKNFRWHDLRHHFASRLVMAGVDLNTVRELLGHSEIAMTLRYAHLAPEHKKKAVELLAR